MIDTDNIEQPCHIMHTCTSTNTYMHKPHTPMQPCSTTHQYPISHTYPLTPTDSLHIHPYPHPHHTKLSSHPIPTSLSARVTAGHTSRRYCSLYLGNNTAKLLSSSKPSGLSLFVNGSTCQWLMPSWSHGLGFLCCA